MRTSTAPHSAGSTNARPAKRRRHVHFFDELPAGVPILQEAGVAGLNLVVEIAWGAVLSADPSTWQWVDVTHDVQTAGGKKVSVTLGRADEASVTQPAQCSFILDNRSGNYSKGGQSVNYPNVKINTPVRVRVIYQSASYIRFYGYAVGFSPDWDHTGNYAIAVVKAEGALRRLQLNKQPIQSALRRAIPSLPNLIEYWPCEDGPLSTTFQSANGGAAMTPTQVVTPASYSGFASSSPLPVVGTGGGWAGAVRAYTSTGQNQFRFMAFIPANGLTDGSVLAKIGTRGSLGQFDVIYYTLSGGSLGLNIYNADLSLFYSSPVFTGTGINGVGLRFSVELSNSGPDLNWKLGTYPVNGATAGYASGTASGRNVSTVWGAFISPNLTENGLAAGHITIENTTSSIFDLIAQVNAYNGDSVQQRMIRLSAENSVPYVVVYDATTDNGYYMGNQPIDTFINCMREGEIVDQGLLCDGVNNGLTYYVRRLKHSEAASMTLDASLGDMAMPFTPVDDDLLMRNKIILTRKGAGDYTAEDDTSAFSVSNVGIYDQSITANLQDDFGDRPASLASWLLHAGISSSQIGYRYPKLELDLARRPAQISSWLSVALAGRIDVLNMHTARVQAQPGPIQLLVEGWTETFDQFRWNASVNASLYETWRLVVLANPTGDTNEFICHLDTDGCVVTSLVAAGASSFNVTVTGLTSWTTASDDFPFQVDVGGIPVTVTAIGALSGGAQTFTVDPTTVLYPIAANTSVSVWRETVLGY